MHGVVTCKFLLPEHLLLHAEGLRLPMLTAEVGGNPRWLPRPESCLAPHAGEPGRSADLQQLPAHMGRQVLQALSQAVAAVVQTSGACPAAAPPPLAGPAWEHSTPAPSGGARCSPPAVACEY